MDSSRNYYIIGFEPNATMETAHHMILHGCSKPGTSKPVWNCGEMTEQSISSGLTAASPCAQNSQVSNLEFSKIAFLTSHKTITK